MQVTEITHKQDGEILTEHKMISLRKATPRIQVKMLAPPDDEPFAVFEPFAVYYFESGWNYGYPTYHVIIEWGDVEQTDNLFLSRQQFIDKFGVDPVDEAQEPANPNF